MEEKTSKTYSREYFFEKSKERMEISISLENIDSSDLNKTKNFLETMFKEILNELI